MQVLTHLQFKIGNNTVENKYCGDVDSGVVPFSPPREMFIPSSEFSLNFHSDAFSHFDGYLMNVISLPKTVYFGFLPFFANVTKTSNEIFACDSSDTVR